METLRSFASPSAAKVGNDSTAAMPSDGLLAGAFSGLSPWSLAFTALLLLVTYDQGMFTFYLSIVILTMISQLSHSKRLPDWPKFQAALHGPLSRICQPQILRVYGQME